MGGLKCEKCEAEIKYKNIDIIWDESGYGYTTKLLKCPKCGYLNIVEYIEDVSLDVNNDIRYYQY